MIFRKEVLLITIGLLCFSACKKRPEVVEENVDPLAGRKVLIQQYWNFDIFTHEETANGMTTYDTIAGGSGDFFDFKSDGNVYSFWGGLPDTTNHKLLDADHLLYAGDTFTIVYLTKTNFEIGRELLTDTTRLADTLRLNR